MAQAQEEVSLKKKCGESNVILLGHFAGKVISSEEEFDNGFVLYDH